MTSPFATAALARRGGGAAVAPRETLVLPHGLLLVAHHERSVLGCAGLRLLGGGAGEVTRVYVAPAARGRGLGSRLLQEIEEAARRQDVSLLRLDTRSDLLEARRLYRRHGYQPVAPFNSAPYAEHWFAKSLTPPIDDRPGLPPLRGAPRAPGRAEQGARAR